MRRFIFRCREEVLFVNRDKIIGWTAAAVLLAGVAATVQTVRATPEKTRQLERKTVDLGRLRAWQEEHLDDLAALQPFEGLKSTEPVSLADLAKKSFADARPDLRFRESRPAAGGWRVDTADVLLEKVRMAEVSLFVLAAENQRPPWKLVECSMTAGEQAPGYGRAVLAIDAVGKKSQ